MLLRQFIDWLRHTSLWLRMAIFMLPTLLMVTGIELWMTSHKTLESANAAYDRSLLGALKSIDSSISTVSGGLSVELPYAMFEFFELTASGQVFFRVATSDGLVELGSADLPKPEHLPSMGTPVFYDATYFGEPVRLVAYQRLLETPPTGSKDRSVIVQIGESTSSRRAFTSGFVRNAAIRDGFVLMLLVLGTAVVLHIALRPLARLAREVEARTPEDLTLIDKHGMPAEVRTLVGAVNHHMARTQNLVSLQRRFLDDASHQLRTHLTTLQMQVDYAKRAAPPEHMLSTLNALGEEIARATRSSQQLLALGRSDTAEISMSEFELESLLRDVAVGLLPQARAKGIDLGMISPVRGAIAIGERALLGEALTNLVTNAIAYNDAADGAITLSATCDRTGWSVSVEDNGPGLSEYERERLGQRFHRGSHADQEGFGLGLAIVRSIAKRHGGALRLLAPESDKGLLATIWWPRPTASCGDEA